MIDFGTDLSCVDDFDEECRAISDPRLILAQALLRRWKTPRGTLLGSPDYGTDLAEALNETVDSRDIARIKAEMLAEARKDERVVDASIIESSYTESTRELRVRVAIDAGELALSLVLTITDVTVTLLSLE